MTDETDHMPSAVRDSFARRGDDGRDGEGVSAGELSDDDLMRELTQLHRTRHDTLLHAPTQALQRHSERTTELELEYLRRRPERDIDETRLRGEVPR